MSSPPHSLITHASRLQAFEDIKNGVERRDDSAAPAEASGPLQVIGQLEEELMLTKTAVANFWPQWRWEIGTPVSVITGRDRHPLRP